MDTRHTSLDRLFEVLTEQRRRYVLYHLNEDNSQVHTLDDLVAQLCTWEREWDNRTDHARDTHEENIRIDLHHVHLPELADAGLIDYDAQTQTARNRVSESVLEAVYHHEHECSQLDALFTNVEVNS